MKSACAGGVANWHEAEEKALCAAEIFMQKCREQGRIPPNKKGQAAAKPPAPTVQSQRCYQSSVRLKARARSSTEELTMTLSPDFMVS